MSMQFDFARYARAFRGVGAIAALALPLTLATSIAPVHWPGVGLAQAAESGHEGGSKGGKGGSGGHETTGGTGDEGGGTEHTGGDEGGSKHAGGKGGGRGHSGNRGGAGGGRGSGMDAILHGPGSERGHEKE